MNSIRTAIRKLPPSTVIKVLRKVFSLPAPAARLILNDVTRPRKAHKPWIRKVAHEDWSGCWIGENLEKLDDAALQDRIAEADLIFFNVHGGGFRVGTCTMYMDTYIQWISVMKKKYNIDALIMSVDYRLAPEFRYPSPVEDIVRAYEHITQVLGVDGSKIIATGDSAGAALVLEMLFITHDPSMFEIVTEDEMDDGAVIKELPRPAGTVLVSPLVTDETTSESWQVNIQHDYITQYTAKVIKKDYFEPPDPESPPDHHQQVLGIAKLQTGFQSFLSPHVLMFVGNKEVLRDDALELAEKAEQDGVAWQTVVEDCVHNWFCVREVVKEREIFDRADDKFADFCYRALVQQNPLGLYRRASEGLDAVPEEDDEDEDDFHEALTTNSDFERQMLERLDLHNDPGSKRSTMTTVYV
ncbi:hypothetical protein DFQ28_002071 [Apophysomyces sp. BC1034]|nr:hypothetical protein DFQ30_002481 [Apophysomyces sp. BC1015]KAG0179883.1 hypothetical protein DFQ29_001536 [Apophysomyces sp. BC1021]KAG0190402.1 hypothetical protein DFQ28_002071 [Apophysomyces sp. BC1034]